MNKPPRIGSYEFGHIVIDGERYTSDVIILPGGVKPDWRRAEGHALRPSDLAAVLEAAPEVLVIGQGAYGYMKVMDDTLACLRDVGIEAVAAPTARAVEIYNERCQQGPAVAAALHLTC